jgi:acyl carrier protein
MGSPETTLETRVWDILDRVTPEPLAQEARSAALDLKDELGINSLAFVSLMFQLEDELGVDVIAAAPDFSQIRTVGDVVRFAAGSARKT